MNTLPKAKKAAILRALTEGNSIRSTGRMVDVSKTTILKLLVEVGEFCDVYQDHVLRNLPCTRIEADEVSVDIPPLTLQDWVCMSPRRPVRPCSRPSCPHMSPCPVHHPTDPRPNAHQRGYTHRWQQIRLAVLAEEPLCRHCLAHGLTVPSADVDHILPKAHGGSDERVNLQGLCHPCHSVKTNTTDRQMRQNPRKHVAIDDNRPT